MERVRSRSEKKEQYETFIEDQNHCALCEGRLIIKTIPVENEQCLREEAYCPRCDVKTRVKNHRVH